MRKFLKGEKLPAWRLNELVETLELLQEKVTELEAKLQSAAGASAGGDRGGAAGGATGAPRARMYKAKGQRPEVVRHLWEPFFLDHRNGLVAPGSPGWYVRKAAGAEPELLDVTPEVGMQVWLRQTTGGAECECCEPALVFQSAGEEPPRDSYGAAECCATVRHVRLGTFGEDCRYANVSMTGFDERRKITFYREPEQIGPLADLLCTGQERENNACSYCAAGEVAVSLLPHGVSQDAGALYVRKLRPAGAVRMKGSAESVVVAGGVDLLPLESPLVAGTADEKTGLPAVECKAEAVPGCVYCVAPGWRELAKLTVGSQEVGLFGYPLTPGRWALRFAPGTMAVGGGAQVWRRYEPDASNGAPVPAPGDTLCGATWAQVASTCMVARYAPATSSGWYDFTALYSTRTLIAPGKNDETGCAWVWFVEEERCKLIQCGAHWGAEGCWRIKSYYSQP